MPRGSEAGLDVVTFSSINVPTTALTQVALSDPLVLGAGENALVRFWAIHQPGTGTTTITITIGIQHVGGGGNTVISALSVPVLASETQKILAYEIPDVASTHNAGAAWQDAVYYAALTQAAATGNGSMLAGTLTVIQF